MTEMTRTVRMGGGFGGANRDQMSEALQFRCALADAEFDRAAAAEQRVRDEWAARDAERRIRASIELAIDRGEIFDVRQAMRNGGIGHTRQEMVALCSARADWEDARLAGLTARRIQDQLNDEWYGDTSAPTHDETIELEAGAARAATLRQQRHERTRTIRAAVRFAAWDRGAR